jgi:demethylmenaquinone methyltransferase / 2-methoxy-6-polyprenyl-1,4-benzoquinol methylase
MGLVVQKMFDEIANRYDFLNHFLSAGRDRAWRKKAASFVQSGKNLRILDLCGGTGDFWKTWSELSSHEQAPSGANTPGTIGVIADFSLPMLREAQAKFSKIEASMPGATKPALVRMDALRPCFKPNSFDAVICAYGMRNLDSVQCGIDEIRPLLRSGGTFITLEFFRPTTLFTRFFYHGLAPLSIPFLGWVFSSRRQAYTYLVESIHKFSSVSEYSEYFRSKGFAEVSVIPCDLGISHIVKAVKG